MSSTPLPGARRSRRSLSAVLALLLTTALLVGLSAVWAPAQAAAVPRSECAKYDKGVRTGVCVRDPRGGIFWLGTLAGYDGREIYCIDYRFATNWGVPHQTQSVTGALPTSLGARVPAATVAALNYLVTRYPGASVNNNTAAAIELIVRQVMGDANTSGRGIPGGLRTGTSVRDVSFVPDAIITRARQLWSEAVLRRGPWSVSVTLDASSVGVGDTVIATVRGKNGSGRPQDLQVALALTGLTGPTSVRLGADGVATVVLRASKAMAAASVAAKVTGAPSPHPVLAVPRDWVRNPRPGQSSKISQRGLLARQPGVALTARSTVAVRKHQPTLVTQASAQQVEIGTKIHDSVVVSGTKGAAGTFQWWLIGPVAPLASGRCPGVGDLAWNSAPVVATGMVSTTGDGTYLTPSYQVTAADLGCLTYAESRPETDSTLPAYTVPGEAEETVLVTKALPAPVVTTVTSRQVGRVGNQLHDRIKIAGIASADRLLVQWTLHGPIKPRAGVAGKAGCERIAEATWLKAPVAARGSVRVQGPGEVKTAAYTVRRPGCYTYSETVAATATTRAVRTRPGIAIETSMITRPGMGTVPSVPTGPFRMAAPAQGGTLRLPALKIKAPVLPVTAKGGSMQIPSAVARLGWLSSTAHVDDVIGSAVIAGHVADRSGRPGALARLAKARKGMVLTWTDASGKTRRYVVSAINRYARSRPLPKSVFRTDGEPVLRLITCTRKVRTGSGYHYADNLVVTARAVR